MWILVRIKKRKVSDMEGGRKDKKGKLCNYILIFNILIIKKKRKSGTIFHHVSDYISFLCLHPYA